MKVFVWTFSKGFGERDHHAAFADTVEEARALLELEWRRQPYSFTVTTEEKMHIKENNPDRIWNKPCAFHM